MSPRPTLQDFIDDELLRAPMTVDLVIDAVHAAWRLRLPPHSRQDGDPARTLQAHRGDLVAGALKALRASAQAELGRRGAVSGPVTAPQRLELSLIGEDDVAVDIEIARCIETIRLQAEAELRELQTYTSALVDDINVSRDTNPFRPDRFVRALWQGVQGLPLSRAAQAAFLHDAAVPLADTLRRSYGAACQRLSEQGVEPASHRTIVVGGGTTWGSEFSRYRPPEDLNGLRDSMPSELDALPATPARAPRPSDAMHATPPAATSPDPQLIELLARLFDAFQTDYGLGPDTVALMQRLQATVLRVALRDASLLDTYDHPVWRFMDHLAHNIETSAPAQRLRLLGLGRNLVDHLAAADGRDGQGFDWALQRLEAAQRHALAQAIGVATPAITRLQRLVDAELAPTTNAMPLDIGTLDTVPADLMPEPGSAPAPADALADGLPPGRQVRAYLQGDWRNLTSLWQDDGHELVLLRESTSDVLWALRQQALARLFSEGLAHALQVRSLVRRAAEKVLRAL